MQIFAYYSADLTARMTAIPSLPKLRTFQDALDQQYEVVLQTVDVSIDLLKHSQPGSGKYKMYQKMVQTGLDKHTVQVMERS